MGGCALPVNICACSSRAAVGWQPWKAQLMCLSAGRDGCRMTSAYHCAADHFLAREGRAAGRCTRAAQPHQPHAGPARGHSHQLGRRRAQDTAHWFRKGSGAGRDREGCRKGEVISRTAQMSHKCRVWCGGAGCLCIPELQVSPRTVTCGRWG